MRNFFVFGLIFSFCSIFSALEATGLSAKRFPEESFQQALQRVLGPESATPKSSAYGTATPLDQLDRSRASEWSSEIYSPIEVFHFIRDYRFMESIHSSFSRRLSWLYPDDGCFARAEMMRLELEEKFGLKSSKLFIFGDLTVKTPFSPYGSVSWWYHVVPAFRQDQQVFVFDPALKFDRPMLLEEWLEVMGQNGKSPLLSLCAGAAYGPSSDCDSPIPDSGVASDQSYYLQMEEDRVLSLGHPVDQILKDLPPWRTETENHFLKKIRPQE